MKVKVLYEKIILALLFLTVYFVSVLQPSYRTPIVFMVGILAIAYPFVRGGNKVRNNSIVRSWLLTLLVVSISMMFTVIDQFYLMFYGVIIIVLFVFNNQDISWAYSGMRLIYGMGIFYAVFTIVPVISESFYITRIVPLLIYNQTFDPVRYLKFGIYSGFTYQTAVNAMYLSMGIGSAFTMYLFGRKRRWVHLVVIGFEILAILLTAKRGHLVFASMALLITTFFNSTRSKRFSNIFKAVVGIFALLLLLYYFVPAVGYFFDRILNLSGDITNGRLDRYLSAIEIFKVHPMFGIGWEKFRYVYSQYSDVHNIYLQLLCETGVVGTGIFIFAFLTTLVKTIRLLSDSIKLIFDEKRPLLVFSLFVQLFFLLYGLTGNGLYDYYILFFYFLAVLIMVNYTITLHVEVNKQ